ncbi:hypothetical protein [Actinomadura nitritigenes]|uniref:hypothetical protein n=1 Tax=Actinomadura nitritigenes TaxID=134602 RepID=UPI003D8BB385
MAVLSGLLVLVAPSGGAPSDAATGSVRVRPGDDWTLPGWVRPSPNSGFFSEQAAPEYHVDLRGLDLTWRQLQPGGPGRLRDDTTGTAEDLTFRPLREQLAQKRPYWMRVFAGGSSWAPGWVADECGVEPIGPDYEGQYHLPIWNECVWERLLGLYKKLFVESGLRADPRLRFVYVPGAFTWAEFDYDIVSAAAEQGLTFEEYRSWYSHAWRDLAALESLPVHDGRHVVATENECFNDCGYTTAEPYYAVRQANLKALQLRMNWVYVVPGPSYMKRYPDQWRWLRLSIGKTASDSPDAWAALRDAEDTYWKDETGPFTGNRAWRTRPWVRNLERWLVQRDVRPDGTPRRSTADVHRNVLSEENGTAYEGLRTDRAHGQTSMYFDVDERFRSRHDRRAVDVKVTYRDAGRGTWWIEYEGGRSPRVRRSGDGAWKTATVRLSRPVFAGRLRGGTDFRIVTGAGDDLDVRFVRVVRRGGP